MGPGLLAVQPSQATARGTLQLLDAYDLAFKAVPEERIHAESKAHGLVEMPYGFFPELVATEHLQDADSLKELLKPISEDPVAILAL